MSLQATRTIGGGDGWDRTDSGIYVPDWAELEDVRPAGVVESPERQPLGIDLFAGAGGFSCGFKQGGWHVIAANEWDVDAAHTYLCNLGSPRTRIVFCTPEDEQRWAKGRNRLKRYHSRPPQPVYLNGQLVEGGRASLEFGSGWIAGEKDVRPCEVFFFGDVRALSGERILAELALDGDAIGCVFGGPPCQGFSKAGKRQPDDPRNELVFEFMRIVCEIHPRSFCMENVPGLLDMVTRDGIPVIDALALMAQEGGMGTFHAIRRSLAETAGAGAALRTMQAGASRRQPQPGMTTNGHVDVEDDQLPLFEASAWLADPQLRLFAEAGAAVVNVSTPKASGARRQETVKRLADQRLRLFAEADATVVNVSDMGEIVANGGDSGPLEIRRGTVELVDAFIGAERECFAEWCVLLDRRGRVDGDAVVASQDRGHAAAERLRSCCANQQLRTVIERERLELLRAQVNEEWAVESAIAAQRRKAQRDPIREAWSERRAWLYSARDALSVALGWPHRGERVTVTGSYHAAETGDRAARQHTYAGPAIYLHTYDTHNVSSQVWVPERDHRGQRFELLVCWEPHETWGRADPAGKVAMRRTAAPEQRLPVPLPRWPTTDDAAAYSPARERADAQASRR